MFSCVIRDLSGVKTGRSKRCNSLSFIRIDLKFVLNLPDKLFIQKNEISKNQGKKNYLKLYPTLKIPKKVQVVAVQKKSVAKKQNTSFFIIFI